MPSGATRRYTCPGDGNADVVSFVNTSSSAAQYAYVITDDQNVILGLPPGNMQDFEGAGSGTCRVWGLSYTGSLTAMMGQNAATASLSSDCFELSDNFIEIVRSNPDDGTVSMPSGATRRYTCPGDGNPDVVSFVNTSSSSAQYAYVITDDQNIILGLPPGNMLDFEGAGSGVCRVWGLSYTGNLTAMMGQNAATVSLSDDCFQLSSNFIEVVRSVPDGGMVTSSDGNTTERICVNGNPDPISFTNNSSSLALYQYIVTDDNGMILAVPPVTTINFDGAGPGLSRVYGASYVGTLNAAAGMNISSVTASECFDLSSNYLTIDRDDDCQDELCTADDFQPGNSTAFATFLRGIAGVPSENYSFDSNGGSLITYDDGTAQLTGTLVMKGHANYQWDVDVWFINKSDWAAWSAMGRTWKGSDPVAFANFTNWDYYEFDVMHAMLTGTPGSLFAGDTISLSPRNGNTDYGFQKGLGANDKNGNFGASTWFDFAGSYSGYGDFNLSLTCNQAPRTVLPQIQLQTPVDQPISQDLRTFVYDPEGSTLTFAVIPTNSLTGIGGLPQHGNLNLQSSGQFTYTPQPSYQGPDAFRFRAVDGGSPTAFVDGTVDITVANGSLPVTWVSFTAQKIDNLAVALDWVTSDENNNDHFVLEKSADLNHFHSLTQVDAQNASGLQSYQFTDRTTMEQTNYYRLKQVDQDGSYSYSSIVEVNFGEGLDSDVLLFPNPAQDMLNIQLPIGRFEMELYNATGHKLQAEAVDVDFAENPYQLDIQHLSQGIYLISIRDHAGQVSVKHFIKQ
jgi:hypothetical protein